MLLRLSNLNSNLALTLGYLNPALNNSAQVSSHFTHFVDFTLCFPLPGNVTDSLDDAEVAVLLKPQLTEACEDGMLF